VTGPGVPVPSLCGRRDRLGHDVDTDRLSPDDHTNRRDDDRRGGQQRERRGETGACERGADTAAEGEPDYRFTLANERTFLAWQRTALGLLAAAVAVVQLVPELTIPGARLVLGALLAVLATLTSAVGLLRWEQADRAIRRGNPLPRHPTPVYLAAGLTLVGMLAIGLVIGKAVTG
jgi:putative membrane protein